MKTLEKKSPIWINLREAIRGLNPHPESTLKIINYPDGQVDVLLNIDDELSDKSPEDFYISVDASCSSWNEIQTITCINSILCRKYSEFKRVLNLRYLIGARSDRRFSANGSHYLRDVIAPVINLMEFDEIRLLDPHSDVSLGVIENSINDEDLYRRFIDLVLSRETGVQRVIVTPDAGAYKKANSQLGKELLIKNELELVSCYKCRDLKTGEITGISVPEYDWKGKKVFIIDDICDGGRTFIELGIALKEAGVEDLYLCVTHGIFSKGIDVLAPYFTKIFTTDSLHQISHDLLETIKIEEIVK